MCDFFAYRSGKRFFHGPSPLKDARVKFHLRDARSSRPFCGVTGYAIVSDQPSTFPMRAVFAHRSSESFFHGPSHFEDACIKYHLMDARSARPFCGVTGDAIVSDQPSRKRNSIGHRSNRGFKRILHRPCPETMKQRLWCHVQLARPFCDAMCHAVVSDLPSPLVFSGGRGMPVELANAWATEGSFAAHGKVLHCCEVVGSVARTTLPTGPFVPSIIVRQMQHA